MTIGEKSQRLTFNKTERLKSRKTIQYLFSYNQQIKIYPFKLIWLTESNNNQLVLKMGVSASKRLFKLAVARNLIKRKMRECLRLNKSVLINELSDKNINLSFMLIYIGNKVVSYNEFNTKINKLLIRLSEKCNTL